MLPQAARRYPLAMENVRHLLLHAAPETPGTADLLARMERGRILLAGPGLAWAGQREVLGALGPGVDVAVCSQDARAAGWTLEDAPPGVRWSSVGTWLAELPAGASLWSALP